MEVVTERLLHEEQKLNDRASTGVSSEDILTSRHRKKKGHKCHFCGKFGHIQRNCRARNETVIKSTRTHVLVYQSTRLAL